MPRADAYFRVADERLTFLRQQALHLKNASYEYNDLSDWELHLDAIGTLPEPFDTLPRFSTVAATIGWGFQDSSPFEPIGADVELFAWAGEYSGQASLHRTKVLPMSPIVQ